MNTQDQSQVIDFLGDPATHGGAAVERLETHTSIVFLAGDRALKLKRAVRYDYLDYSTPERRREMCEEELRINRRTAPGWYLDVVAVTQQPDGTLALRGEGTPIDWILEMRRFDQHALLSRMADDGVLPLDAMPVLATTIARFHARAERRSDQGGWHAMRSIVDGNAEGFSQDAGGALSAERCAALTQQARLAVNRFSTLLDARRYDGWVRECHGDLHLGNIVMVNGVPTLFDGVEFDEAISCVDVMYDLAFVLMDLWRRGLRTHANLLFNRYLAGSVDLDALPLLPLFLSCRAAVKAKTTATAAALQPDAARVAELRATAEDYLTLAIAHLNPPPACLIGIGGYSGSGKSTVARAIAPMIGGAPGALILRSDEIRRRLCNAHLDDPLTSRAYTAEANRRVYETVKAQAEKALRAGHSVVADAVFARPADREDLQAIAAAAGVPFVGVWLEAPEPILISRVAHRVADISEATPDIVRRQLAAGVGSVGWSRIDSSAPVDQVSATVIQRVPDHLCSWGIFPTPRDSSRVSGRSEDFHAVS